jgi:hypothetical protein
MYWLNQESWPYATMSISPSACSTEYSLACPSALQHKSDMERRLVGPATGLPGAGQAADVDDLASEAAGLRLQLVEALEELEARERELREARDTAVGQHHKMQALSDQVRGRSRAHGSFPQQSSCYVLGVHTWPLHPSMVPTDTTDFAASSLLCWLPCR